MPYNSSNFHVFRLTFNSQFEGLGTSISDEEKLRAARQLFDCIDEKMTFLDGNSHPVEADPPDKLDACIVYTRMSKETLETLTAKGTHKENKVKDYPYFNVVFDFRHPLDYILVAIERKSRAFSNVGTVSQGLECYFNQHITEWGVRLRAASLSRRFWYRIEQKCLSGATRLKSVSVEIPDVGTSFPLDVSDDEQAFLSSFLQMVRKVGADGARFAFGAGGDGKWLEVDRVRENWGRVVHLACQNGYVIKARLGNGLEVSSAVDAPAVYQMDKRILGDGGEEKIPLQERWQKIKEWFDKIYQELKEIEREEEADGKSKRHIKK